jgi:RNA polymerase sigma factor (sigma-70 family)
VKESFFLLTPMDAAELSSIEACITGDLTRFDALYTQHVDAIYKYVYRRTLAREVAEDITSTTFLKALQGIRAFDPKKGELRAWLYRIARNAMIDHFRNPASKTVNIETVWDLPSEDLTSLRAERAIDAEKLHAAMKHLSSQQREVVLLRLWEGLSYKEIAALTGKSEGNCKVIFSRAVAELRTHLPSLLILILFSRSL